MISSNKLQAATTKGDEHLNIPSSRSNPAAQKRAKPRQPFFSSGGVVRCTSRRQKLRKDQGLQVQNSLEMRIALAQGGKHQPAMGSGHCAGEMSNRMKITDVKTGACRSCMILQHSSDCGWCKCCKVSRPRSVSEHVYASQLKRWRH